MRKIFTIITLLISFSGFGQIRIVDSTGKAGNVNTVTPRALNTTNAGIIFAQIAEYDGVTFGTLTDSKSNTWTQLRVDRVSATVANYIYYCSPCIVGTSHTFTYTKTGSFCALNIIALGNTTSSPIDQQNGTFLAAGSSIQPGSMTPTQNNEMAIATVATSNVGTVTVSGGYTVSSNVAFASGLNQGAVMAYQLQTTATATNATFSFSLMGPAAASAFTVKWLGNTGGGYWILAQ